MVLFNTQFFFLLKGSSESPNQQSFQNRQSGHQSNQSSENSQNLNKSEPSTSRWSKNMTGAPAGSWKCTKCPGTVMNYPHRKTCYKCNGPPNADDIVGLPNNEPTGLPAWEPVIKKPDGGSKKPNYSQSMQNCYKHF